MNEERCGACEEQEILTPTTIINRPGLDTLVYRVGTHASFMETMKARLSSSNFPALADLKARDSRDPSIALLDAWAIVADVLTFYQERIANEGYLRTAKEYRSVLELASLVDYTPGPGVSPSVLLALTIEDGYNTEIPTGTRVESLPSSGGLPQPFETSEPLVARADLNTLKPRTTEPQRITLSPPSTTSPPGTTPPTPPGTTPPTPPGTTPPTPPGTTPPTPPGTTPPTPPGTTPPTPPGTTPPTPPGTTPPTPPGTTPPTPPGTTPPTPPGTTPPTPPGTTPPTPPGTTPPTPPGTTPPTPPGTTPPTPPGTTPPTPPGTTPPTPPGTTPPTPPGTTPPTPPGTTPPTPPGTTPPTPPGTTPPTPPGTTPPTPPGTTPPTPPGTTPPTPPGTTPPTPPGTTPPTPPGTTPPTPLGTTPPTPPGTTPPTPLATTPPTPPGTTPPTPPATTPPTPLGTTPPTPLGTTPPTPPGTTPPEQPPTQPPEGSVPPTDATQIDKVYLKGIATNLTIGDGLLFVFGNGQGQQVFRQVQSVEIQPAQERTLIVLQPNSPGSNSRGSILPTQNPGQIPQQIQQQPKEGSQIYALRVKNAPFGHDAPLRPIYDEGKGQVKRFEEWLITGKDDPADQPFTSPPDNKMPSLVDALNPFKLIGTAISMAGDALESLSQGSGELPQQEQNLLPLDAQYNKIIAGSWVVIKRLDKPQLLICRVTKIGDISQAKYRMTGRVTQLTLEQPWLTGGDKLLTVFRKTTVYAESELLDLADKPIDEQKQNDSSGANNEQNPLDGSNNENFPSGDDNEQNSTADGNNGEKNPNTPQGSSLNASSQEIELDGLHEGLEPGRWVIVSGERSDVPNKSGIIASEAVMLAGVRHGVRQVPSSSNIPSQTPPNGGTSQTPPNGGTSQTPPNGIPSQTPPNGIPSQTPPNGIPSQTPPNGIPSQTPPNGIPSQTPPNGIPSQTPPNGIPSQTPPNGIPSQTPPSNSNGFQSLPGEKPHTFLQLAKPLTYSYKPDTVTIYGNVVKATHGETSTEILGSGDATQEFQKFTLSHTPLTHLSAPKPTGTDSTLEVFVKDVPWHEVKSLAQAGPNDHCFITHTDDNGNTTVIFGNGRNGARLPSGVENVRAVYRVGVGKEGNVEAGQINQLVAPPLGLRGVFNPLPETGGTNRESSELVRRNAPLKMMSFDRAVSVQDYANFARTTAWIGKASATLLGDRHRQIIHLTIASVEDVPVDKNSDSYRNFLKALHQFGNPHLTTQVNSRELMLLFISAKVRILPQQNWELVTPNIRTALSNTFSFENRELGQDVFLSEVISTIQQVPGVDYVDVNILDSVSETEARNPIILREKLKNLAILGTQLGEKQPQQPKERIIVNLANINPMANGQSRIQRAQLAIFNPQVAGTLILQELKS